MYLANILSIIIRWMIMCCAYIWKGVFMNKCTLSVSPIDIDFLRIMSKLVSAFVPTLLVYFPKSISPVAFRYEHLVTSNRISDLPNFQSHSRTFKCVKILHVTLHLVTVQDIWNSTHLSVRSCIITLWVDFGCLGFKIHPEGSHTASYDIECWIFSISLISIWTQIINLQCSHFWAGIKLSLEVIFLCRKHT